MFRRLFASPYFAPAQREALSRLTVVIPTYERPHYLARALRYWSGSGAKVLVMDGSKEAHKRSRRFAFDTNVTYLHRPVRLAERLALAGDLADTPYTVLVGDDEFHTASGLIAAMRALDDDPELVACCGRVARFALARDFTVTGAPGYPRFAGHDILHDTAEERMVAHMADYVPTSIYGVVRTNVWKAGMRPASRDEIPIFASAELQFELTVMALGKSRVLPVLQWLRSAELGSTQSTDISLSTKVRLHDIWGIPDHQALCRRLIESTAKPLAELQGDDLAAVTVQIETALEAYVTSTRERVAKARTTPERNLASSARAKAPPKSFQTTLYNAAASMKGTGVEVDLPELTRIEKLVRSHATWFCFRPSHFLFRSIGHKRRL